MISMILAAAFGFVLTMSGADYTTGYYWVLLAIYFVSIVYHVERARR